MRFSLFPLLLLLFSCQATPASTQRQDEPFMRAFKSVHEKKNLTCSRPRTFYLDQDRDGYGDDTKQVRACHPPEGYVEKRGDCDDMDRRVFPGQKSFFSIPTKGGSFDFDCDGKASVRLINRAFCKEKEDHTGCTLSSGWDIKHGTKIPRCGQPQKWAWNECRAEIISDSTVSATALKEELAPQKIKKSYRCWKGKLSWKKRQLCR